MRNADEGNVRDNDVGAADVEETMALRALKTTKRAQKCACDEGLVAGVVPCCHGPCLQGDDELADDEFDNAGNAETKWLQACRSPPYRL